MSRSSDDSRNRLAIRSADPRCDSILSLSLPTPIGRMRLAASPAGVVRVELPGPDADACMNLWLALHFPEATRRSGVSPILRKAATQLEMYFTGSLRAFALPVDLAGTPFQRSVWEQVAKIRFGATDSYAEVARAIDRPAALRAVGAAQAANPLPIVVPCHRVVGTDGDLTGYGGGLDVKRWLLDHESALARGLVAAKRDIQPPRRVRVLDIAARRPSPLRPRPPIA